jgi:cytochrome b561
MTVIRYHPFLVALHWLIALAILGMFAVGFIGFDLFKDDDPAKVRLVAMHMVAGISILALMAVRLVARSVTDLPPPAGTGRPKPDRLAAAVHVALYVLVAVIVASGLTAALQADVVRSVFGAAGGRLPEMADLDKNPAFNIHGLAAIALAALVVLHAAAAFYHQHVLKDGLISRMTFGPRRTDR